MKAAQRVEKDGKEDDDPPNAQCPQQIVHIRLDFNRLTTDGAFSSWRCTHQGSQGMQAHSSATSASIWTYLHILQTHLLSAEEIPLFSTHQVSHYCRSLWDPHPQACNVDLAAGFASALYSWSQSLRPPSFCIALVTLNSPRTRSPSNRWTWKPSCHAFHPTCRFSPETFLECIHIHDVRTQYVLSPNIVMNRSDIV